MEIGIRTMFNTVEKLLRFTDALYMAVGVYHGTVFEKVAALLLRLGVERGIVVQGCDGRQANPHADRRKRRFLPRYDRSRLIGTYG
ncbi:hypothetical protein [Brevibacillus centrosporus]|uniref:Glycosyl transferase family, a/b domain n=1 Tax=Brevibacillus centrosporus TaxID=54910 RepID=A0A1I3LGK6_9BACL|nr:hypothetical protein [Brevibacillus centrosporus]SFI83851.1 Glycosyl transferase family, a/b domain [Brevibacillus centrosporus]